MLQKICGRNITYQMFLFYSQCTTQSVSPWGGIRMLQDLYIKEWNVVCPRLSVCVHKPFVTDLVGMVSTFVTHPLQFDYSLIVFVS